MKLESNTNIKKTYQKLKESLAQELSEVDQLILKYAENHVELIPEISSYITSSGGKRLRPLLTLACAKIFGKVNNAAVKLASAVEFIHTATLLHDDVVDQSEKRRGQPTANHVWDNKSCILVGDFLFSQAFKLMVATGNIKALELLSNASAVIAESEVWQLGLLDDLEMSQEKYLQLVTGKTAVLFAAACASGALEGGCDKEQEAKLYDYGINLGISFQIVDDILDYIGDAGTGKKAGNDYLEGKITLPIICAYANADNEGKEKIQNLLKPENRSNKNFEEFRSVLIQFDGIVNSREVAMSYTNAAVKSLSSAPESETVHLLLEYTNELLDRIN